jgi:hypothetical protein
MTSAGLRCSPCETGLLRKGGNRAAISRRTGELGVEIDSFAVAKMEEEFMKKEGVFVMNKVAGVYLRPWSRGIKRRGCRAV